MRRRGLWHRFWDALARLVCRLRGHDRRQWWNPERSGWFCVRCGVDLP